MRKTKLWNVRITTTALLTDAVEEILSAQAAAVSVLAPPRQKAVRIDAIFQTKPSARKIGAQLIVAALVHKTKLPKIAISEVGNLDWLKKVAADFPPIKIARWTIHGATHKKAVKDRANALQIDASSAFGTGEHPTTRGCLIMLDQLMRAKALKTATPCMMDVGCGSGILAMAFAQATHGKAYAVELDAQSAQIARANVWDNGLKAYVKILRGDGYRLATTHKAAPFDLIMANIFANPLCEMAPALKKHLRPGGFAILAGLLNTQAAMVLKAHKQQGLTLYKKLVIGEWTILAFKKPSKAK